MKKVAIGIDIGGTNTLFGLVDNSGECLIKKSLLTSNYDTPEKLIKAIFDGVQEMKDNRNDIEIIGIGVGAPNGNFYNGTIEYAPNLKWKGVINLIQLFRKYFDLPVYVTNDANAAA